MTSKSIFAPVCVFAYKRADLFSLCLDALSKCRGAKDTDLRVYIDGPKDHLEVELVNKSIDVAREIDKSTFKSVAVFISESNKGLASSVIAGVTETINMHGAVIVLEDDLIPVVNYLEYMNASLINYQKMKNIGSISGFGFLVASADGYSNYFHPRPNTWGWATWLDRWNMAIWDLSCQPELEDAEFRKKFNNGGQDLYRMLMNYQKGKIDSWGIRWAYSHYKHGWLASSPVTSKISNLGYGEGGTNCSGAAPPPICIDDGETSSFIFRNEIAEKREISRQVDWYNSNIYKIFGKFRQIFRVGHSNGLHK